MENKPKVQLQEWEYDAYRSSFTGKVYGHPNIKDGHIIRTTKAKHYTHKENEIETLNTIYILGEKKNGDSSGV